MADPIHRYFKGRPYAGTGVASDYFRRPPDLSYLEEPDNGEFPVPDDSGYAVSPVQAHHLSLDPRQAKFQEQQATLSGRIPDWMLNQLKQEQGIGEDMNQDDRRRRSDAAWAMHFLNKADPSSPDFSEGVARMFQQFPGAAQDKNVLNQVQQIRTHVPASRVRPEAQRVMKQLWSMNQDDPQFIENAGALISNMPDEVLADGRMLPFINQTLSRIESARQRRQFFDEKRADKEEYAKREAEARKEALNLRKQQYIEGKFMKPLGDAFADTLIEVPDEEKIAAFKKAHKNAPPKSDKDWESAYDMTGGQKKRKFMAEFQAAVANGYNPPPEIVERYNQLKAGQAPQAPQAAPQSTETAPVVKPLPAASLTREQVLALPSGTPILMPDGSIKHKK